MALIQVSEILPFTQIDGGHHLVDLSTSKHALICLIYDFRRMAKYDLQYVMQKEWTNYQHGMNA